MTAFKRDVLRALVVRVTGAGLLFASNVVLARVLGATDYGSYSVGLAAVTLMAIPASAGLPTLMTREVARARQGGSAEEFRRLMSFAARALVLNSLLVLSLTLLWKRGDWREALIFALVGGLLALEQLRAGVMQGLGGGVIAQIPEALVRPVCLMAAIALAGSLLPNVTGKIALGLFGVALATSFFAGGLMARPLLRQTRWEQVSERSEQKLLPSWARLGVLGASQRTMGTLDLLILGGLAQATVVADYKIALQFLMVGTLVQAAAAPVTLAELARISADRGMASAGPVVVRIAWFLTLLTAAVAIGVVAVAPSVIQWGFGDEFANAFPLLIPLLIGQVVNAATGPSLSVLALSNYEMDAVWAVLLGLAVMGIGMPLAFAEYGPVGAAWAIAFAHLVMNIALAIRVRSRLGFNPAVQFGRRR